MFKSTFQLGFVSIVGMLAQFFVIPIVARSFSYEDVAVIGAANNLATFFTLISCFGLLPLINILKGNSKALNATAGLVIFSFISSIPFFYFFYLIFGKVYGVNVEGVVFLLVILFCFSNLFYEITSALLLRRKNVAKLSFFKIYSSVSYSAIQIVVCFFWPKLALVLIGRLVSVIASIFHVRIVKSIFNAFYFFSRQNFKNVILDNSHLLKFNFPSNVIGLVNKSIPYFLLGSVFGSPFLLAAFALIDRMLNVPLNLARNSISMIVLKHCSVKHAKKEFFFKDVLLVSLLFLILGAFFIFFVKLYSSSIVSIVFGPAWTNVGDYLFWLSIPFVFQLCLSPLNQAVIVAGESRYTFLMVLLEFIFKLFLVGICIYSSFTASQFIKYFSIAGASSLFLNFLVCCYVLRRF